MLLARDVCILLPDKSATAFPSCPLPDDASQIKEEYMGLHGGTSTIVYFLCALEAKDLCKPSRWRDAERVHLANQAVRILRL